MKEYKFVNETSIQKGIDFSLITLGLIVLLYGFTQSVPFCSIFTLLGGTIGYKLHLSKSYKLYKVIKHNLYDLVKNNNFYTIEEDKVIYRPTIFYDFNDSFITIKIRLDGSKFRDKYTKLEKLLEDLFVLECVSKEEQRGYIIYKLDRTNTKRLDASSINMLSMDYIAINNKLKWNFRKCPHALISGVTGKGKTYFLAYLIKSFLLINATIKIVDPKMSDLSYLEKIFGNNVVSAPNKIAQILRKTVEEMNNRYMEFKELKNYGFGKDYKDYGYLPIVIIFDEVAAFMASTDKKISKEVNGYLSEIILKGRQAGVFMILTTQRPDADVIPTDIRDQLGLRIALGEMSKVAYTMIFGSEFNDLELNSSTVGTGFIYMNGTTSKPVKFESPYFSADYNFVKDVSFRLH
ncbi:DNA segregation ATPase FtsK/SpoIIIE-like protein [Clostridium acetobutylicum]|uniref:FtsK-like DNA segregation ATPase, YDCQ B.subtilis ortholog n=1 Tax=Clostridium acetobutylicum (strain ATCC 824 / DSM 792 / JCM 1419 / IAM 19013 / LMG 5710 / NBRC 13948 / NRRL B-527 / VKM B-1787 / 2291 / W) TaxID=272562 RepID=Q97HY5_CLOAB|nr:MULTISPECIES: FtsK/SpoIIIE domain-containing protein [Clostridium]AAK79835.1 FtsK-like DNA segregation ATPase, YDCQ B.subtilis ortholog [Clostridium acetobutylicum ATCC 824]AEI32014.1 FtsK-like DNA segregation ATPase [Clostridium acetobutylicum DSM 1731]AWV79735.1 DNA translocase FtsK [Clostridium acetobutylicum]MBC2394287.1 DNA translocase FtsK [Clostridium acetobutylicum]MBC2586573.1 DNA translocase FtsK [Clostridium acetobutylicum]